MRLVPRPTMLVGGLVAVLALGTLPALGAPTAAPPALEPVTLAAASNPVTPGNFTGRAFDQCETVSESAMRTWRRSSPYRAVGVYISGDSRFCKTQKNLTAGWVRNQLADGWRIMPITLGPQASCSSRFPRYSARVDPVISAASGNTYGKARAQGRAEAEDAVRAAKRLGIVPGSTLFYDLEAWNLRQSSACNASALWFTSAWTRRLHQLGYASGFYSSAASGIKLLDDERVRAGSPHTLPDQIWIADWDGKRNTSTSYIRSDGWQDGGRAKQYLGGHNERYGGVTINIDSNWLELRTPKIPGGSAAPAPAPAPAPKPPATGRPSNPTPRYTGANMSDAKCSPGSINKPAYRRTGWNRPANLTALQCVLKQRGRYPYQVTGRWNDPFERGMRAFQRSAGHQARPYFVTQNWVALHASGLTGRSLGSRSAGADVTWLQRSLNAATGARLRVTGRYDAATARTVAGYQKKVGLPATRTVGPRTLKALRAGRIS